MPCLVLELTPADCATVLERPLLGGLLTAGFPSPGDDFIDLAIDLNRDLIRNPSATFYGRVAGDSMKNLGIGDGDLLVIDRSLRPTDGRVAVCCLDGEFTIKRLRRGEGCYWLDPANEAYQSIRVTDENQLVIWGIVVHVIKTL